MRRGDSLNDEETDTEEVDGDYTESEESVVDKKSGFLGIPFNSFSIKHLPKKCVKFTFITINSMTCVSKCFNIIIQKLINTNNKKYSCLVFRLLSYPFGCWQTPASCYV